jgi:hypothetical protein
MAPQHAQTNHQRSPGTKPQTCSFMLCAPEATTGAVKPPQLIVHASIFDNRGDASSNLFVPREVLPVWRMNDIYFIESDQFAYAVKPAANFLHCYSAHCMA